MVPLNCVCRLEACGPGAPAKTTVVVSTSKGYWDRGLPARTQGKPFAGVMICKLLKHRLSYLQDRLLAHKFLLFPILNLSYKLSLISTYVLISQVMELTESEIDLLLARFADKITERRMAIPAILFLEMHKPLTTLLHQASMVSISLVTPLVGAKFGQKFLQVLESRKNIETLICLLEDRQRRVQEGQ